MSSGRDMAADRFRWSQAVEKFASGYLQNWWAQSGCDQDETCATTFFGGQPHACKGQGMEGEHTTALLPVRRHFLVPTVEATWS